MFMQHAINAAQKAEKEIPVGAIIVQNGKIIASTANSKEQDNDISAHAEILALRIAAQKLNRWRLEDCDMYVTLEPCPMCAWAIIQARIKSVYFGSYDANYGALGSKIDLRKLNSSKLKVYGGIMEEECNNILKKYFENLRIK